MKEGADVNSVNRKGETVLIYASSHHLFRCEMKQFDCSVECLGNISDHNVCFYTLIKAGADVNTVLSYKSTVLISAVQRHCEIGVGVNKCNPDGYTTLMEAVK